MPLVAAVIRWENRQLATSIGGGKRSRIDSRTGGGPLPLLGAVTRSAL
jgi:hypothetical protein